MTGAAGDVEPFIEPLTDDDEASIDAAFAREKAERGDADRAAAEAAAGRRAAWMTIPAAKRWVTVLLDIDEVVCVGQPYSAGKLLKSLQQGEEFDAQLLAQLFSRPAIDTIEHVHQSMGGRVRYVISSSWRDYFTRSQLEQIFRSAGLKVVADNLHPGAAWRCYQARYRPMRDIDIHHWIDSHHSGEPFTIIDDHHSGGGLAGHCAWPDAQFFGRVVLCTPGIGLTMIHAPKILAALRRPVTPNLHQQREHQA